MNESLQYLQLAEGALDRVIVEFDGLEKPHYHMIGNHELYNVPRSVPPTAKLHPPPLQNLS